jgi:hypothetical protein
MQSIIAFIKRIFGFEHHDRQFVLRGDKQHHPIHSELPVHHAADEDPATGAPMTRQPQIVVRSGPSISAVVVDRLRDKKLKSEGPNDK